MGSWDTLNCANHPERIALERCEVCGKPLCAYCLYYTEDGQRLCQGHAEEARLRGIGVEEPGAYADQLIGAQVGAFSKQKRGATRDDDELYKGNSTDLMSLIGLLVGVISLGMCCGAGSCLPLVGFVLSLLAILSARKAYDPSRTRKFAAIGMLVSGAWLLLIAGCIIFYGISLGSLARFQTSTIATLVWPTHTPQPTASPTVTPESTDESDLSNAVFDRVP